MEKPTGGKSKRSSLGYGSSYRKGRADRQGEAITSVLGGATWNIKPDRRAMAEKPCLWMEAGAVPYKNCTRLTDCIACPFDRAMQARADKGLQASWRETMRARSGLQRTCRHSLTGRIGMRACARDFNCARCDFDQFFEEVCAPRSSAPVGDPRPIRGFALPAAFHLHIGHAWVRREEGGFLRVGLDDFALKLFGRFDRMELPLTGHRLDQGRPGWAVQRQDRRAEVLAPLDGVVVDVNARVRERPDLASRDPYGAGWLFTLHAEGGGSLPEDLMSGEACRGWMAGEVDRLEEMIEEVAGPLAADGGYLAEEIFGKLPALDWNRLSRAFLRT